MPLRLRHPPEHEPNTATVELEHVWVYRNGVPALEDITFRLEQGEQVAVLGPNGAGKSTLFQVIVGIIRPDKGRVHIYGSGPDKHICIGYVPQRNQIDWHFPVTVWDVVMMGRVGRIGFLRWPGKRDRELVAQALEEVGMLAYRDRQIGELSGGQQQRVFLARALAQEAELLLLDEPLTGLDIPSQEAILAILDRLRSKGISIIVATHDLGQVMGRYDRVLLLNRRLIADGPPEEVLRPQVLAQAFGSHLHILPTPEGTVAVPDTCCGNEEMVQPLLLGEREHRGR